MDTFEEDARRFYDTGVLEPLPQFADACRSGKTRVALKGPFGHDAGAAYVAQLPPELRELADSPESPRRSPFLLCEGETALIEPHTVQDTIRRDGQGRYVHWGDRVYFASSDGTDPNRNGRTYALVRMR